MSWMSHNRRGTKRPWLSAALIASLASAGRAQGVRVDPPALDQEQGQEKEQGASQEAGAGQGQAKPGKPGKAGTIGKPDLRELSPISEEDRSDELTKLFAEVELRLGRIDRLLIDASAGETSKLAEVGESGIDKLLDSAQSPPPSAGGGGSGQPQPGGMGGMLQRSQQEGQSVIESIDQIIEIASRPSSSGSGSPQQSEGPNPLDQQGQAKTDKTKSPEGPDPKQKDGQQGEEPKSPKDSKDKGEQKQGDKMPEQDTEQPRALDPNYRNWGELPIHYRDIFRAEGGQDMPAEYRDWIDSYYRRLNTRSGG